MPRNKIMARALLLLTILVAATDAVAADSFLPVYQSGSAVLVEDLVIEGDDEGEFLYRGRVAVDSKGDIFVLDRRIKCIKKFDVNGEWLSTFSREGEGPGELRLAFHIEAGPGDHVTVYDLGNRRLTEFSNDGVYVDSASLADMGFDIFQGFAIRADGGFIVNVLEQNMSGRPGPGTTRLKHYSHDLMQQTVLDSAEVALTQFIPRGDGGLVVTAPFYENLYWGMLPSQRVASVWAGDYSMKLFSSSGSLITQKKHDGERLRVTDSDRAEYFEDFDEDIRGQISFPKYKPHVVGLHVDHEGYILLETFETVGEDKLYDIFTPDLDLVGRITLPSLGRAVLCGGYIYDWRTINDGESFHLYRYRLAVAD